MRLEVRDVRLDVGTRILLDGLSFTALAGDVVGIVGPSGVGKSTLLATLAGFLTPTSGTITFFDDDDVLVAHPAVDWMIQTTPLLLKRSARDNVSSGALMRGRPVSDAQVQDALSSLGLAGQASQRAALMSGGERQRLALARALVAGGDVVIADEPTASLDADSRAKVLSGFGWLAQQGRICLIATHDPAVAEQCTAVVALEGYRAHDAA